MLIEDFFVFASVGISCPDSLGSFSFTCCRKANLTCSIPSGVPIKLVTAFDSPEERELFASAFATNNAVYEVVHHTRRSDAFAGILI